jgi:hypothetical protein
MICRPAAVIHTVAISMVLLPATMRSAVAVSSPRADKLDHLRNRESVRQHDRLGHAVAVGEQSGAVAQMAKQGERGIDERGACPSIPKRAFGCGPQARRTRARLVCGGDTRSGKAFVSQCAVETPCGDTSRQKVLRYQQTA